MVTALLLFRALAQCRLFGRCQRFGETWCLHLQGWIKHIIPDLLILTDGLCAEFPPVCDSWGFHVSPEDGDSMFLRNAGIYRRVYMAPKPKKSSSSAPTWKFQSQIWDNLYESLSPSLCNVLQSLRNLFSAYPGHIIVSVVSASMTVMINILQWPWQNMCRVFPFQVAISVCKANH
jgi:hypothetical protein